MATISTLHSLGGILALNLLPLPLFLSTRNENHLPEGKKHKKVDIQDVGKKDWKNHLSSKYRITSKQPVVTPVWDKFNTLIVLTALSFRI